MGTCECENPMEFGYEVQAEEKGQEFPTKNLYTQKNIYTSKNEVNNNKNPIKNVVNGGINKGNTNNINNYQYQSINNNSKENQLERVNSLKERYENEKNPNEENDEVYSNNNQFLFNTTSDEPRDEFSKYIFDNINNIRENPQSFIPTIEKAKSKIMLDKNGICIFRSTVKVALSRGMPAFDEAIEFLRNLEPMSKLIFSRELLIDPPQHEDQIKDKAYMNEIINQKVTAGVPIKSFWRDIIRDPETCLILMIVDDTGANSGKKRNDILDPNMQCIGIISKRIGKNFSSYVTLC